MAKKKIGVAAAVAAAKAYATANLQGRLDNGRLPLNAGDDDVAVDTEDEGTLKAAWERVTMNFTLNGAATAYSGVFGVSSGEAKFDLKLRHDGQRDSDFNYHVPFHPYAKEAKDAEVAAARKEQLAQAAKKKAELEAAAVKKKAADEALQKAAKDAKALYDKTVQATVTKLNKDAKYKALTGPKQKVQRVADVQAAVKGASSDALLKPILAKLAAGYTG